MPPLLSILLLTPLAAAVASWAVNRRHTAVHRGIAALSTTAALAVAVLLWRGYDPAGPPWQFREQAGALGTWGIGHSLGVDGFSLLLILLTALLGLVAVLASWTVTHRVRAFHQYLLAWQAAALGAFMALDAVVFLVCCEVLVIVTSLLIAGWGGPARRGAAVRFFGFGQAANVALLIGMAGIAASSHAASGSYSFDVTEWQQLALPLATQKWIFLALLVGFGVQMAIVPFQLWLPAAQANAPAAVTIVTAAVLLKVGTYGLIRFSLPILPDASRAFVPLVVTMAIGSVVFGVVRAFRQQDWQGLLAWLTVSQTGLIVLGMFAITPTALSGSLLHQINHGIAVAALLAVVSAVAERRRSGDLASFSGLFAATPVLATLGLVAVLASVGLPGLNGFAGMLLIVRGVYAVHPAWAWAGGLGAAAGAVCLLHIYRRIAFGTRGMRADVSRVDVTGRELAMLVPLTAAAIWIGLYPAPLLDRLHPTMARVITRLDPGYAPAFSTVPGCGSATAPAPSAPLGFTAIAPCDTAAPSSGTSPSK